VGRAARLKQAGFAADGEGPIVTIRDFLKFADLAA